MVKGRKRKKGYLAKKSRPNKNSPRKRTKSRVKPSKGIAKTESGFSNIFGKVESKNTIRGSKKKSGKSVKNEANKKKRFKFTVGVPNNKKTGPETAKAKTGFWGSILGSSKTKATIKDEVKSKLDKKLEPVKFKPLNSSEKAILSAEEIKRLDLRTLTEKLEKQKTGVTGLDQLFSEGIPKGASVLIEGGPGSGKTLLCLQLAYNVCKKGGNALYMSFEEPEMRLLDHMKSFGWDPAKYVKNNQLLVKRYSAIDISRSVEALLSAAKKELLIEVRPVFFPKGFKPNIVLIDSLTSIASAFSGESSRFRVYMEQLFKYLEAENITSFLIRETPSPTHIGKNTDGRESAVSFLSDGIISLYNVILQSGERTGGIEIVKMRGEKFKKRIVQLEITDKGLVINPDQRIEISNVIT